jgi:hypothetical protein
MRSAGPRARQLNFTTRGLKALFIWAYNFGCGQLVWIATADAAIAARLAKRQVAPRRDPPGAHKACSGQGCLEQTEHPAPGLLGLRLVIGHGIRRAPAVLGPGIDFDLGLEVRAVERLA